MMAKERETARRASRIWLRLAFWRRFASPVDGIGLRSTDFWLLQDSDAVATARLIPGRTGAGSVSASFLLGRACFN
jgi:hypothetical protein